MAYAGAIFVERDKEPIVEYMRSNITLLKANAYCAVIKINLSEVAGAKIDEVECWQMSGSCMTNIGHFRAAGKVLEGKSDIPTRLWIAPPTKMDALILSEEGYYGVLGKSGARMEMPGCSLRPKGSTLGVRP